MTYNDTHTHTHLEFMSCCFFTCSSMLPNLCFQFMLPASVWILLHVRLLSVAGLLSRSCNVMKKLHNLDRGTHRSSFHRLKLKQFLLRPSKIVAVRQSLTLTNIIMRNPSILRKTKALDFNLEHFARFSIRYTGSICKHPSDCILRHGLAFGECGRRHPSQQQGTLALKETSLSLVLADRF